MSQVDGQLVFSDPDNAHSLIVRAAEPQEGETGMAVQITLLLPTTCTRSRLSSAERLAKARVIKGLPHSTRLLKTFDLNSAGPVSAG